MTLIADLSRYDPDIAAGQYDAVILNVEDPSVATKAHIAHDAGKPAMLYSWVYPGRGVQAVERAVTLVHSASLPVDGIWLDYEQDGVVPQDILDAHTADSGGQPVGVYAYLAMMDSQGQPLIDAIGGWPLWMAYYPGANDGTYDASYSEDARARGAVLHQYTSTNGTRDLSVVLSDDWYSSWTTGHPPKPTPVPQEDDMTAWAVIDGKDAAYQGVWVQEGPYLLWHFARASDVSQGRLAFISTDGIKTIIADVNKARAAAGIK